jgi:ATP-dependent DNA helicase RecQ
LFDPIPLREPVENILKQYWGYQSFRPLQEEIIQSVIRGSDTLALLPTGGGKSICFQVPALAVEGICIVISPLIALMQDQVQNLRRRGIKAVAINSAQSKREIDQLLDNAVYGDVKFLYISPERIETELFQARLQKMKVNFIAVDEAHCISEWGFNFRPAYRKIRVLRELLPETPVIALTATATPKVVVDIKEQLDFKDGNTFQGSFKRDNLIYVVQEEKNKLSRTLSIARKLGGSGIVYVRSRRESIRQANLLRANNFSALPYHAGMTFKERKDVQEAWIKNRAQIVVATNAFGMGIDKPDVRFVVHLSLPQSVEAYFQEAGRAGRDGKLAYAVCLKDEGDVEFLRERVSEQIPDPDKARNIYRALTNHYQLAVGSDLSVGKPIDIISFSKKYNFKPIETYNALKLLESHEYAYLSEAVHKPSQIRFLMKSKELYNFEIKQPKYEGIIHHLLRSFEGVFDHPVKIDENQIAIQLKTSPEKVRSLLQELSQFRIMEYQEQTSLPLISFPESRVHNDAIRFDKSYLKEENERIMGRAHAMISYSENDLVCRSIQLVGYFGEKSAERCGKCDVCVASKKASGASGKIIEKVSEELKNKELGLDELLKKLNFANREKSSALRWMVDNNLIRIDNENRIELVDNEES